MKRGRRGLTEAQRDRGTEGENLATKGTKKTKERARKGNKLTRRRGEAEEKEEKTRGLEI